VTDYVLLHFSNEVSVTFFGSQFHGLSARANLNLDFLSDKKVKFQFLCPSRHLDEVSPVSTSEDSASCRILRTFDLKFPFSGPNFCIHFEESNRIFFFFSWMNPEKLDQTSRPFTF